MENHVVAFVEQRHTGAQIGHYGFPRPPEIEIAGQVSAAEKSQVFAFQREGLNTAIPAVRNQQYRFAAARIEYDAVRAIQLACLFTQPSKAPKILARLVVNVDVTGAIAVADVDIPIWRDCKIGRAV